MGVEPGLSPLVNRLIFQEASKSDPELFKLHIFGEQENAHLHGKYQKIHSVGLDIIYSFVCMTTREV